MKLAVIEDSSHQVIVNENQEIELAYRKNLKENEEISVDKVLLLKNNKDVKIGSPYVDKSAVKLKFLRHSRDKKITVFKYHAKTAYRRTKGHKQRHSIFKVVKITP